jgi:hypothetical protein
MTGTTTTTTPGTSTTSTTSTTPAFALAATDVRTGGSAGSSGSTGSGSGLAFTGVTDLPGLLASAIGLGLLGLLLVVTGHRRATHLNRSH